MYLSIYCQLIHWKSISTLNTTFIYNRMLYTQEEIVFSGGCFHAIYMSDGWLMPYEGLREASLDSLLKIIAIDIVVHEKIPSTRLFSLVCNPLKERVLKYFHYYTPLRPTSKGSSARVERPSSARRAYTRRATVEHRRALDGIFLAWHRNGLILLRGAWPYLCHAKKIPSSARRCSTAARRVYARRALEGHSTRALDHLLVGLSGVH